MPTVLLRPDGHLAWAGDDQQDLLGAAPVVRRRRWLSRPSQRCLSVAGAMLGPDPRRPAGWSRYLGLRTWPGPRIDMPREAGAVMLSTDYVPGAPNWVDLGTPDIDTAAAFYGAVFGW